MILDKQSLVSRRRGLSELGRNCSKWLLVAGGSALPLLMPFPVRPHLQGTILAVQFPLCLLARRKWGWS